MQVSNQTRVLQLQCGDLYVEIAPEIGAAITAFYRVDEAGKRFDYLRPTTAQAIAAGTISEMASFLMAPWAGRIRNGRFEYQGREIHYPSQDPTQPHSMHGFTRDKAWLLGEYQLNHDASGDDDATLRNDTRHSQGAEPENNIMHSQDAELKYKVMHNQNASLENNAARNDTKNESRCAYARLYFTHQASKEWPFSFTLEQTIRLSPQELRIDLRVCNTGSESMPFGFGHHPFYPCDADTLVQAQVGQAWQGDHEVMPIALIDHPAQPKLAEGLRVQAEEHDTVFVAWQHEARISWLAQGESLVLQASAPQDFFVLYAPANQPWFCAEPFANVTDSFNLRARYTSDVIGGLDIAAGQSHSTWFSLRPEPYTGP
ncbi:MAG: hypothetical protein Q4G54_07405 [Pelistega sp.]|nr:hypothetical protein [Pelistega sp.]